jgi:hypothetical protein
LVKSSQKYEEVAVKISFRFARVAVAALAALAALTGCVTTGKRPPTTLSIHLQTSPVFPEQLVRQVWLEKPGISLYVKSTAELTELHVDHAELDETAGGPYVRLVFADHGAIALRSLTTEYRNRYLVVFVNNEPVMAYYITHTINDGRLTLIADIPEAEVRRIVSDLQAAKLDKRRAP